MKTYKFLLIFLLTHLCGSAQIHWSNPTPTGWINTKIHFVNDSTGFLMNNNGDLFISRDTGNSWLRHGYFPTAKTIAMNGSTGIIPCYNGSIYISTNYGETWLKNAASPGTMLEESWADVVGTDTLFVLQNANNVDHKLFRSVNLGITWEYISTLHQFTVETMDFLDSRHAFVRHPNGMFKTKDGGVSWQQIFDESTSVDITTVKFYDTLRGVAYRETIGMMRTYDGGASWAISNEVNFDIFDILYIDSLNLFALGDNGIFFSSSNGGINWTVIDASGSNGSKRLTAQYFFTKNYGIVAGVHGRLLKTRNGGDSWEIYSPTYTDVTGISFGDSTTGYASTWNNLYKTTDAGRNWQALNLTANGNNTRFEHSRFTSKDTGFVTTTHPPRLQHTSDGGTTWTPGFFPNESNYDHISSLSFFSKDSAYAALLSNNSGLFKTTNGGKNWQEIGSSQRFNLLYFITDKYGYGTRWDRIFRTTDGGLNWTVLGPPASTRFTGIWFMTAAKGITVGEQGQLRMTVDSGVSWTNIFLDPFQLPDYNGISFYNDSIGYTTSDEGTFYKTVDGGLTWHQKGQLPSNPNKILFRPDSTAMFAGENGMIITTPIAEYSIDSVKLFAAACAAELRAQIGAFLSPVDSIWFEYGTRNYTHQIDASPSTVANKRINVTANASNLHADSIYHIRVKVRFRGAYYYSDDYLVAPTKATAPLITANGNVLRSSVPNGNQWYMNGVLIPNAINQEYTATSNGIYTVTAVEAGCPTVKSADYSFAITSTFDVSSLNDEIKLYPNPVQSDVVNLFVRNNRSMSLKIQRIDGSIVIAERFLQKGNNLLSLKQLPPGIYVFTLTDRKTFVRVQKKLVRL
jgi:photosystem II stability/assembly factor-like uncharacterized protein